MKYLTKSNYQTGLQCPRLLWIAKNTPERIPPMDIGKEFIMKQGTFIGELATKLYPEGINVETSFFENIKQTKELIKKRVTLFEPGITNDRCYARVDILKPVGKDKWDIIEVKSGTSVKPENYSDVAFQHHVLTNAGYKINKVFILYINNKYIRKEKFELEKLFTIEDVTKEIAEYQIDMKENIKEMLEVIDLEKEPESEISNNCKRPYVCSLKEECFNFKDGNVFEFYRLGKKAFDLYYDDCIDMKKTPASFKLSKHQLIQKKCAITGKPYIDKEKMQEFLDTIEYPIYYFDFEAYNPALPPYKGLKPYQQIAFQYSLHIQKEPNSELEHISFIAKEGKDPRREMIESLENNLGSRGTILAYFKSFEERIIKSLVNDFPEYQEWNRSILKRFRDLIVPFTNFYYYDPKQKGSCSIKAVLPALTDISYNDLEINNGQLASVQYNYISHGDFKGNKPTKEDIVNIRKALDVYCTQDTYAMVKLLEKMKKVKKI